MISDSYMKQFLEETEQAIKTERLISSSKPSKRPYKDSMITCMRHNYTCMKIKSDKIESKKTGNETFEIKLNKVTAPKHCSLKRVDELKPILLKDMYVNKVHHGRYLRCKIVGEPFYLTGISMLVEDETSDVENVTVYDYTTSYDIEPSSVLPMNSTIIIKEPFLKTMISENNNFYIRVESPTDIVILCSSASSLKHPVLMSYEQLNDLGNRAFKTKEYRDAIQNYDMALKMNPKASKTFLNRAAAYFELEMFHEAYLSTQEALKLEASEKAYYRLGRVFYSMRQFEQAADAFRKSQDLFKSGDKQITNELRRCEERLNEARLGKYNMKALIEQVKAGVLRLDVADFMASDLIEIRDVPKKGKGIVALKAIKRGTLLVASKAASIAYESEIKIKVLTNNFYTKRIDDFTQTQNLKNLYFKLQHDPYMAKQVYELYAGDEVDRTKQVPESILDTTRIDLICTHNSFRSEDLILFRKQDKTELQLFGERKFLADNTGLWIVPSYFNHSCVPNTLRIFLKDFVLFYSSRDIASGEELTTQYCGGDDYEERAKKCQNFNFTCTCSLCEFERTDPKREQRKRLLAQYKEKKASIEKGSLGEKCLQKYFKMVQDTYKNEIDDYLRVDMQRPLLLLLFYYLRQADFKKVAETQMELFNLNKNSNTLFATQVVFQALFSYAIAFMINETKKTLQIAKNYCIGDLEYYSFMLGVDLEKMGI